MVIRVIPVIDRSVMFTNEQIMIAHEIVFHYGPFNTYGKSSWSIRSKLKDTFSQKRKAITQLRSNKQILFAQSKRNFVVLEKRR